MRRYAVVVQYLGENYSGSQIQPNKRTVQGELEKAISTLIKNNTKIILSGRTDKGVGAYAQVAHFDCEQELEESRFVNSLNGVLPNDISIFRLCEADKSFHAQKSAKWRWYRYEVTNRTQRSVFDSGSLLVRYKLDLARMNEALGWLVGRHDCSAFKASKTDNPAKVCEVIYAKARRVENRIMIDFVADRFLYNMVRIVVGTLLMIEKDDLSPEALKVILESRNRRKAGPTVSPDGLRLVKVAYGETFKEDNITNTIIMEKTIDENLFGKAS